MPDLDYNPHTILRYLSYFMAVWFLFILFLGTSRYRASSFVLSCLWLTYSYLMFNGMLKKMSNIEGLGALINLDFSAGLALAIIMFADKTAWKHALVFVFAILCHTVVSYILTSGNSQGLRFMYIWYSELIILTCILQMIISYDGAIRAFHNVQQLLYGSSGNNNNFAQDLFEQPKREGKT